MNFSQRKRCPNSATKWHSQAAKNVIQYIKSELVSSLKMTQAACTIGITLGVMTVNLKLIITGYAASVKPTKGVIGE